MKVKWHKKNSKGDFFQRNKKLLKIIFSQKKWQIILFFLIGMSMILSGILPMINIKLYDDGIAKGNLENIIKYILLWLFFGIMDCGLSISICGLSAKIGQIIVFKLKTKLLKIISSGSGKFFSEMDTGNIYVTVLSDTLAIQSLVSQSLTNNILQIVTGIVITVFLITVSWDLVIVTLITTPIFFYIQGVLCNLIKNYTEKSRDITTLYQKNMINYVNNISQFIYNNMQKYFFRKYFKASKEYINIQIKNEIIQEATNELNCISKMLSMVVLISYGGFKISQGDLTLGGLIAFIQYSNRVLEPFDALNRLRVLISKSGVSINRINKILNQNMGNKDRGYLHKSLKNSNITFKNVSFAYNDKLILDNVNCLFEWGKINVIIGKSGVGKSTIIKLIKKYWNVDEGEILIGDDVLSNYSTSYIRKSIGLVTQEPFFINDSLRNNLALGRKIRDEDIFKVCSEVCIYDKVVGLEDGLDTIMSQNGTNFSGGEKQRLAIARILLQECEIMVFDEPTNALDADTEAGIIELIKKLSKQMLVIVITHRKELMEFGEKFIRVNDGHIVESETLIGLDEE